MGSYSFLHIFSADAGPAELLSMRQTSDFLEPAGHPAVFVLSAFFEFKERMRPDFAGGNVIPIDFKNFQNLPALVAHAGEMHHDVDAGCNLSADCRDWNGQAHQNHGFKARKHVLRTVSVTGAEAAVMSWIFFITTLWTECFLHRFLTNQSQNN